MNNESNQTLKKVFNDYIAREDLNCRVVADKLGVSLQVISDLANHNRYSNRTAKAMIEKLGDEFKPFAYTKKCNKCGGEFYPGDMRQIQCKKCRGNGEVKIKKVNKKPKISLGEMERMAEKKEMSYGQFVGLKKLEADKEKNKEIYKRFISNKKKIEDLKESINEWAYYLNLKPIEVQKMFYDKDIYSESKSRRKAARKIFVKSVIRHSKKNVLKEVLELKKMLSNKETEVQRQIRSFNSYDTFRIKRMEDENGKVKGYQ